MNRALVLGLFSGLGFLDRCFEEVGFSVVRGPDLLWGHDIRGWHPARGRFDGIIAGVPCQHWSPLVHMVRHVHGENAVAPDMFPELERVVAEADPAWFLTECAKDSPVPSVPGYEVTSCILDNRWIGDGIGQVQMRRRRFCFGTRLGAAIQDCSPEYAVLEASAVEPAVAGDPRATPVAVGGSGKPKRAHVQDVGADLALLESPHSEPAVTTKEKSPDAYERLATHNRRRAVQDCSPDFALFEHPETENTVIGQGSDGHEGKFKLDRGGLVRPWVRRHVLDVSPDVALLENAASQPAVVAAESKAHEHTRPDAGGGALPNHRKRRSVAYCLELQGWPRDFLDDAPFTVEMKYRLVGNGVPRALGLAVARAVVRAIYPAWAVAS